MGSVASVDIAGKSGFAPASEEYTNNLIEEAPWLESKAGNKWFIEGWAALPHHVYVHPRLTGNDIRLLLTLAGLAYDGPYVTASLQTIAERFPVGGQNPKAKQGGVSGSRPHSKQAVRDALARLKAAGVIEEEKDASLATGRRFVLLWKTTGVRGRQDRADQPGSNRQSGDSNRQYGDSTGGGGLKSIGGGGSKALEGGAPICWTQRRMAFGELQRTLVGEAGRASDGWN